MLKAPSNRDIGDHAARQLAASENKAVAQAKKGRREGLVNKKFSALNAQDKDQLLQAIAEHLGFIKVGG